MRQIRADGVRIARPLYQAEGSGLLPTSALHLYLDRIGLGVARQLNRLWHRTLPRFGTGCIDRLEEYYDAAAEAHVTICRLRELLAPFGAWAEHRDKARRAAGLSYLLPGDPLVDKATMFTPPLPTMGHCRRAVEELWSKEQP